MVSPEPTTTAPLACLASFPVSKEISLPPISTETRVTSNMLICCVSLPAARLAAALASELSFSVGAMLATGGWRSRPMVARRIGALQAVVGYGQRRTLGVWGNGEAPNRHQRRPQTPPPDLCDRSPRAVCARGRAGRSGRDSVGPRGRPRLRRSAGPGECAAVQRNHAHVRRNEDRRERDPSPPAGHRDGRPVPHDRHLPWLG